MSTIVIADKGSIPDWVADLDSFRRWARSDEYPQSGWVSVRKDTEVLRELYWDAGIPEYWLVDARGPNPAFEILRHAADGYVATEATETGIFSTVFDTSFRLRQQTDPLGHPEYVLEYSK